MKVHKAFLQKIIKEEIKKVLYEEEGPQKELHQQQRLDQISPDGAEDVMAALERKLTKHFIDYRNIITKNPTHNKNDLPKFDKQLKMIAPGMTNREIVGLLDGKIDRQLFSFIKNALLRDQNVATQSDKLDSYELSQSPDSKIDQGAESTQPYKVRDPDAGFMRVPKDDEAYEEEDLRQGIKNMSQLENKRNQMKIKKVYLQRVIKEEMQKLLEGQRRRRMAQPKAAAAPAVDPYLTQPNASAVAAARKAAQPLPPPPPVGVAPVKRSAQAGTALKPGVKVPMPSTDAPPVSMHYVPGTVNPAVNAKVASVEKGQHPVQQGIYNLKSLQPAAQGANVPVYSALGVQMGSVPAGKAPPNLLPIKDEQGSIIGYKSPN